MVESKNQFPVSVFIQQTLTGACWDLALRCTDRREAWLESKKEKPWGLPFCGGN